MSATFPYVAWKLMPSFKPATVIIALHGREEGFAITESGSYLQLREIFPTKADAITEGLRRVTEMEARAKKMLESAAKNRAVLLSEEGI